MINPVIPEPTVKVWVNKLPPIPTPPVTVKSPVVDELEAIPEVIAIPEANVFVPNIV